MTEPTPEGRPLAGWTEHDRALLQGIARSLASIATSVFWIATIIVISGIAGFLTFIVAVADS